MLYKNIFNGYVTAFGDIGGGLSITKNEYKELLLLFEQRPAAPESYAYMLNATTLEWELVELPPEPDPDPEAEISDYEQELADLGVRLK